MTFEVIARQTHESSREYTYRLLRTNILSLTVPPGATISENEVAEIVAVSRTPVREAFIKLSQEALLDIQPQRGTYVSLIDPDHVDEARFLRASVETEVIKLACRSFPAELLISLESSIRLQELSASENAPLKFFAHDETLHQTLFAGCGKARVWAVIQQMNTHYNRVRVLNLLKGYNMPRIIDEHRSIVRAVRDRDAAAGVRAADRHLSMIHIDIKQLQQEFPDYFTPSRRQPGT